MHLPRVWALADLDKDDALDRDEFVVAMQLLTECRRTGQMPSTLPAEMVPPAKKALVDRAVAAAPPRPPPPARTATQAASPPSPRNPTVVDVKQAVRGVLNDIGITHMMDNDDEFIASMVVSGTGRE